MMDTTLNLQRNLVEQFLCDVRDHFRASLETSEYENSSNLFHVTEAEATTKLLKRCELLLEECRQGNSSDKSDVTKTRNPYQKQPTLMSSDSNGIQISKSKLNDSTESASNGNNDDSAYLDMTANCKKLARGSHEYLNFNDSADSEKTFRCSTRLDSVCKNARRTEADTDADTDEVGYERRNAIASNYDSDHDDEDDYDAEDSYDEDERQIYDICQVEPVSTQSSLPSIKTSPSNGANNDDEWNDGNETEKQKCETSNPASASTLFDNCPYDDLPASHLCIQKSTKYGQLQRIEKRLFFDQCKKYYCGILNNWFLCYVDGPASVQPSITLYLRTPGIEIEHAGEGKRREICFQITTGDPNRRFVFQAANEVDAKEWIHAIETAIRSDISSPSKTTPRKQQMPPTPTPIPTQTTPISTTTVKRMVFNRNSNSKKTEPNRHQNQRQIDCIYEEPSSIYETELVPITTQPANGRLPESFEECDDPIAIARNFNYDIPKSPAQPISRADEHQQKPPMKVNEPTSPTESETVSLLLFDVTPPSLPHGQTESNASSNEKTDFQTKVKDLHIKLSTQLSVGPPRKAALKKTYSGSSNDSETISLTPTPLSLTKELKKHKKSNTPNTSPQKSHAEPTSQGSVEKTTKNWFLNRLNKSTSSLRGSPNSSTNSTSGKGRISEKENLLNSLENNDQIDGSTTDSCLNNNNSSNTNNNNSTKSNNWSKGQSPTAARVPSSSSASTSTSTSTPSSSQISSNCLNSTKSKVNMIINKFEATGAHFTMFSMDAFTANTLGNISSAFCDNDCNNYEPIMTVSTPPSSLLKKV